MIAELYGKISSRGTNLSESLEDNLTGNIFGSLRYIPFSKGIKKILNEVIDDNDFDEYESEEWADRIEFWPYHKEGELDLVINLNSVTIAIEVKYNSGLSSDDDISNPKVLEDGQEFKISKNQLARESRIVSEFAIENGTKPILLFIAKDKEGREIVSDVEKRNIIQTEVEFKFISWENICLIIKEIYKFGELNYFEKIVIEDIYNLLVKKGFNSFKDFKKSINNIEIDKDKFYLFNIKEEKLSNEDDEFSFINDTKVEKGGYYEFL